MHRRVVVLALAALLLALPACDDDDETGDGSANADTGGDAGNGGDSSVEDVPVEVELPELGTDWQIIEPGGDTICSRGTPYRYAVRGGTVNKLVVDFMGGGACWNTETCGFAGAIFNEDVSDLEEQFGGDYGGIYDVTNADNPFRDWYHVFVPYCTGDIHWGDAEVTYGEGSPDEVTIRHRGAVNAQAVLDWVGDNFSAPEQIFVTGCSAGAYGSIMWAPHVIQMYPNANVVQFGDSGAGVITDDFFNDSFPSWNPFGVFPSWIPALDPAQVDVYGLALHDLYGRIASHYADCTFTQFNTNWDNNQTFYFQAMGGSSVAEWSQRMRASVAEAESQAANFHAYTAPGEQHCIIPFDNFYTVTSDGVSLVDWINGLLGDDSIESVDCGDGCGPNPEEE